MERVLFLTIKKRWFDLIKSGAKKTEYRDIKPRFDILLKKDYDFVLFQNGYRKDSPRVKLKYNGCKIHFIQGGNDCIPMYGIELGEIINEHQKTISDLHRRNDKARRPGESLQARLPESIG